MDQGEPRHRTVPDAGAIAPLHASLRPGVLMPEWFCSDAHLHRWQSETGKSGGFILSPRDALAVGVALFRPVLASVQVEQCRDGTAT